MSCCVIPNLQMAQLRASWLTCFMSVGLGSYLELDIVLWHSTQLLGLDSFLCLDLGHFQAWKPARSWIQCHRIPTTAVAQHLWGHLCLFPVIPPKPHSLVLHIGAYFLCLVVLESNDFLKSVPLYNIRFNMYYFKGILQILIYQYWQFNMLILTFVHLKLLILAEKMTNKIEYIMLLWQLQFFTQKGKKSKALVIELWNYELLIFVFSIYILFLCLPNCLWWFCIAFPDR